MAGFCWCSLAASERQNTHPGRRRTSTTAGRSAQREDAFTVAAAVPLLGVGSRVRVAPAMSDNLVVTLAAADEAAIVRSACVGGEVCDASAEDD